jgi:DNA-binding response OmpR family regulator
MLARSLARLEQEDVDNVIDVHVARLRGKLDLNRPVSVIHTVRGTGFVLREGAP